MTQTATKLVNRELLNSLRFPINSVQLAQEQKSKVASLLQTSIIIGRRYNDKVKITFSDSEGAKTVEETVIHAGSDIVCLQGGNTIPFNRISEVELPF